jgi:hypothetical protein
MYQAFSQIFPRAVLRIGLCYCLLAEEMAMSQNIVSDDHYPVVRYDQHVFVNQAGLVSYQSSSKENSIRLILRARLVELNLR